MAGRNLLFSNMEQAERNLPYVFVVYLVVAAVGYLATKLLFRKRKTKIPRLA